MTRANRRRSAGRLAFQLALLAPLGSAIFGGCSSGVKTVSVDCPTGGTGALAGGAGVNAGASSGASAGALGMAGEAGQGQGQGQAGAEGGEGGGAASSQGGESGEAGSSIGGHGGSSGTAGHSGGHGGTAGGSAGSSAGGPAVALCGDKVTTPPEFCDDGTNTDLSYGCYACTTLPEGRAPQGAMQCDACLAGKSLTSCELCQDYRACYGCLREQASAPRFQGSFNCPNTDDDDIPDDPSTHKALSDRCFNPSDPWGSQQIGGPAGSATRGAVCQTLMACVLRTGCAAVVPDPGATIFINCYCGTGCEVGGVFKPANGPCVNEVRDAAAPPAGTTTETEAPLVGQQAGDLDSAVGVVQQLVDCAADAHGCRDICFPNSSTGGGGGTAGTAGVGGSSGHGGS